jgi:lipoprotein-anchoring transpeptidase ErfK/SrfK
MIEFFASRSAWIPVKLGMVGFATFLAASPALPPVTQPQPAAVQASMAPAPAPAAAAAPALAAAPVPAQALAPRPAALAEPVRGFPVNAVLDLGRPLEAREFAWNDEGVPAGPMTIVVDLTDQLIYVYRGGIEIGRSYIIQGDTDKPTPLGVFPILQKSKDHVSNLYDARMPYMMRLTWDGIAIHESEVDESAATHGCIGIPEGFSSTLFANAKLGDRVLVTKSWKPVKTPQNA